MRKTNAGVSLMELLTVVMVIGILAAIAIPSYGNYTRRANRADAKTALLAAAGQLERCFTRFNSYAAADGCTWVSGVPSTEGKYTIAATTQDATEFVLQATPVDGQGQEHDAECGSFTLDSANSRDIVVSGAPTAARVQRCWSK